jgi:hypothetical protein
MQLLSTPTRWAFFNALVATGLPVATGSGGFAIPKSHAVDAVCAGNMDWINKTEGQQQPTLLVTANGRGTYKGTHLYFSICSSHNRPRRVSWAGELDLAPDAMHAAIQELGEWRL